MRAYEFLTEKELHELDAKKLKQLAAAGLLGSTLALTPASKSTNVAQSPIPTQTTQSVKSGDPKIAVKKEPNQQIAKSDSTEKTKAELPKNLKDMPVKEKKKQFFDTVIPLIEKANREILIDRKRIISIKDKDNLSDEDQKWLLKMYSRYKIENNDIDILLRRVDIVPVSLAASQAAIESGWGTSRFAQEGNALFGQRDYSGGGIKPTGASGFTVAKFNNVFDSIQSYMLNLNTQSSYKQFRERRAKMRNDGEKINGIHLAKTLDKYSERGHDYINDVVSVIRANDLG